MTIDFTSRAWTDSNRDYFERNIVTAGGIVADNPAAREYGEFAANNARPTWPTWDEVARWDSQNVAYTAPAGGATPPPERIQLALDAAIERHAGRCHLNVRPIDPDGVVDPDGDPVEIPAAVKLATIMLAARLARRAQTPDGIAGTSEITGLIRTSSMDPDIEALLAPHLALGLY